MLGGGAVILNSSHPVFRDCVFTGNTTQGNGGAVAAYASTASFDNCAIVANAGTYGAGGIELWFGSTVIADSCEFADNTTGGVPGDGAVCDNCSATLVCCETSPELWSGDGTVVFNNDGCTVATEQVTWGDVKALFR